MAGEGVGPAGGGWVRDAAGTEKVEARAPGEAPDDAAAPAGPDARAGFAPRVPGTSGVGLRLAAALDEQLAAIDAGRTAGVQNGPYLALGAAAVERWAVEGVTAENVRAISDALGDTTRVARAGHNGQDNLAWGIACALEGQPEPERLRILGQLRASPVGSRLLIDLANAALGTDHVFPEDRRAGALLAYAAHVDLSRAPREQVDAFDRLGKWHATLLAGAPTLEAKIRLADDLVAVSSLLHAPGMEESAAAHTAERVGRAIIGGSLDEFLNERSGRQMLERLSRTIVGAGGMSRHLGVAPYLQLRVDAKRAELDPVSGRAGGAPCMNVYMADAGAEAPPGPFGFAERPTADLLRSAGVARHSNDMGDLVRVLELATQGDHKLESLQIMSHGNEAVICMGTDNIVPSDFDAEGNARPGKTRALLDTIKTSLAPGATLHFSACDQANSEVLMNISKYLGNDIVVYGHEGFGAPFVPGDMRFRNGALLPTPAPVETLSEGLNALSRLIEGGQEKGRKTLRRFLNPG